MYVVITDEWMGVRIAEGHGVLCTRNVDSTRLRFVCSIVSTRRFAVMLFLYSPTRMLFFSRIPSVNILFTYAHILHVDLSTSLNDFVQFCTSAEATKRSQATSERLRAS